MDLSEAAEKEAVTSEITRDSDAAGDAAPLSGSGEEAEGEIRLLRTTG